MYTVQYSPIDYCTVYSIVFGSTRTFLCGKGVRAPVLRIAELVPVPDSDYTVNFCCPKNVGAKLFGQIYWKQNVCDNLVNLVCVNIAKKLFFIQFYAESEPARKG